MPGPNFTSVTLHSDTYNALSKIYLENKDALRMVGITSMSGLFGKIIHSYTTDFEITDLFTDSELKTIREIFKVGKND